MVDLTLTHTYGLVGGLTVQFAEGAWPGEIGPGLTMTDEAFLLIEPLVDAACPAWTFQHRWGVFELSMSERKELARLLRDFENCGTADKQDSEKQDFRLSLAEWVESHIQFEGPFSILGW